MGLGGGDGTVGERGRCDVFLKIFEPPTGISDGIQLNFPPLAAVEIDTRFIDESILPVEVVSFPESPLDVDQLDDRRCGLLLTPGRQTYHPMIVRL